MLFAGEALPAVRTENHGDTTSLNSETMAMAKWEAAVLLLMNQLAYKRVVSKAVAVKGYGWKLYKYEASRGTLAAGVSMKEIGK